MFNRLLISILGGAALWAILISPAAAAESKGAPACITKHRGESVVQPKSLDMYEHRVHLTNGCKETVRVRVCYKGTKNCVVPAVAPGEKAIRLGAKRGESRFDYTVAVQPATQPAKKKTDDKKKQEKK